MNCNHCGIKIYFNKRGTKSKHFCLAMIKKCPLCKRTLYKGFDVHYNCIKAVREELARMRKEMTTSWIRQGLRMSEIEKDFKVW
jgi:NAD-dependent SIR2 family protein deacetylase